MSRHEYWYESDHEDDEDDDDGDYLLSPRDRIDYRRTIERSREHRDLMRELDDMDRW